MVTLRVFAVMTAGGLIPFSAFAQTTASAGLQHANKSVGEVVAPSQVQMMQPMAFRPTLGVHTTQVGNAVFVSSVNTGSAAERTGLRVGDQILYLAAQQIQSTQQLQNEVAKLKPAAKLDMFVVRSGYPLVVAVTMPGIPIEKSQPNSQEQIWQSQQQVYQLNQQLHYQNQQINRLRSGARRICIPPTDPVDYEWWLRVQRGETNNDPAIFQ